MRNLNYELKKLCIRNKDGSYSTQNSRKERLQKIANILHESGYKNMNATSLKPKHIDALIKHWNETETSVGTIKNYMTSLRWWAEKINKSSIISKNNAHYGIGERKFVTNTDKGQDLEPEKLKLIKDEHLKLSLELQAKFGLRREESIKFMPNYADKGTHILLKGTWTKGGKERSIPVTTNEQRDLLTKIHNLVGKGSLIPQSKTFIQQLKMYEGQTAKAGFSKLHGLRHRYAQQLYTQHTGRLPPVLGGKTSKELSSDEKKLDKEVRLFISKQLGHEREQITAIYLGR